VAQLTGLVLGALGFFIAVGMFHTPDDDPHRQLGVTVFVLSALQPINAWLRPHKGAPWRAHWEWLHRLWGAMVAVMGLWNVFMGSNKYQALYDANSKCAHWGPLLSVLAMFFLIACFFSTESQSTCMPCLLLHLLSTYSCT
jgi:hypothetical protein